MLGVRFFVHARSTILLTSAFDHPRSSTPSSPTIRATFNRIVAGVYSVRPERDLKFTVKLSSDARVAATLKRAQPPLPHSRRIKIRNTSGRGRT